MFTDGGGWIDEEAISAALSRDAATQQGGGGLFPVAGGFVGQGFLQFGKPGFKGIVVFPVGKIGDAILAYFHGQILAGVGIETDFEFYLPVEYYIEPSVFCSAGFAGSPGL
jgi:hypothetical protein